MKQDILANQGVAPLNTPLSTIAELRLIVLREKLSDGTTEQQLPRVSSPVGS